MAATMQNMSKSPVISLNFDINFHLSEENIWHFSKNLYNRVS
jgi:hypothetical protein